VDERNPPFPRCLEAEYTLGVVATRSKDEKVTQISVTFIPEASK